MEENTEQSRASNSLIKLIRELPTVKSKFMEVCGTHTVTVFQSGIRQTILKEKEVQLVSGPGCPVCVTPADEIEQVAQRVTEDSSVILTTYGDLVKVKGRSSSFAMARGMGADVRVVVSPQDNIEIALDNPNRKVLFFSTGFETTQPGIAHTILRSRDLGIKNFFVFVSHKLIIPVLEVLLKDPRLNIEGFILPGHVSTIIGEDVYSFIPLKYNLPGVIAGFEPVDVIHALLHLLRMKLEGKPKIVNIYGRAVRKEGNIHARKLIDAVFSPTDAYWRGVGLVKSSGHRLKEEFSQFDAFTEFGFQRVCSDDNAFGPCKCGEVLLGLITPLECPLFGNPCTPENPMGACMVSGEGTCANFYRFGERK